MARAVTRKKMLTTRTFRLDEEIDRVLEVEAERQFLSVNALVNKILRRYKNFGRFAERHEVIHFFHNEAKTVLDRLNPDGLQELGKRLGATSPQATLNLMGMEVAMESLAFYIEEVMSRYLRWCKVEKVVFDDRVRYSLRHDLGVGWSNFLHSYLEAMLKYLFKARASVELVGDVVVCTIWKS